MSRLRRVAVAVLLAALTVSGGCGTDPTDVPDSLPQNVDPAAVAFPFDAYVTSDESVRVFETARMYVAIDCLQEFGFDVQPWEPEGPPRMAWNRYGLWDADDAKTIGYESPPTTDGDMSMAAIPPEAWESHVYDGWFEGSGVSPTYNGVAIPEGGCQGEGLRAIGDVGDWDRSYLDNLATEAGESAKADSRTQTKITEWSTCMADAGYQYADPAEPFGKWSAERNARQDEQGENIEASPEELAAAVIDVNCKTSTGLLSTWISVEIEYQTTIIDREGEALTEWKAAVDASLEKARQIIEKYEN